VPRGKKKAEKENNDIGSLLMVQAISQGGPAEPKNVEALQAFCSLLVSHNFSSYEVIVLCS